MQVELILFDMVWKIVELILCMVLRLTTKKSINLIGHLKAVIVLKKIGYLVNIK